MNVYELCIFRLAEEGLLSEQSARVLKSVFRKSGISKLLLEEESGVEGKELDEAIDKLISLEAIEIYAGKYFCTRKESVLLSLVEKVQELEYAISYE